MPRKPLYNGPVGDSVTVRRPCGDGGSKRTIASRGPHCQGDRGIRRRTSARRSASHPRCVVLAGPPPHPPHPLNPLLSAARPRSEIDLPRGKLGGLLRPPSLRSGRRNQRLPARVRVVVRPAPEALPLSGFRGCCAPAGAPEMPRGLCGPRRRRRARSAPFVGPAPLRVRSCALSPAACRLPPSRRRSRARAPFARASGCGRGSSFGPLGVLRSGLLRGPARRQIPGACAPLRLGPSCPAPGPFRGPPSGIPPPVKCRHTWPAGGAFGGLPSGLARPPPHRGAGSGVCRRGFCGVSPHIARGCALGSGAGLRAMPPAG